MAVPQGMTMVTVTPATCPPGAPLRAAGMRPVPARVRNSLSRRWSGSCRPPPRLSTINTEPYLDLKESTTIATPRENLLKVLRHRRPDWIPLTGHCDPYNQPSREGMDPALAKALGEVRWGDTSTVVFSRYLGLDIMDWFGMPAVRISRRNVIVESRTEGDVTANVWHTPAGDLREVTRVCRDSSGAVSSNWTEHLVKEPKDLAALAATFEDEVIEPDPAGIERTRERRKLIGEDGLILGAMDGTPLGNVTVAQGRKALGDRITIMAGVNQLAGPMDDRAAVRADIHQMIREAGDGDHFILGLAAYPNRNMEQTKFVVDCCREIGGSGDGG